VKIVEIIMTQSFKEFRNRLLRLSPYNIIKTMLNKLNKEFKKNRFLRYRKNATFLLTNSKEIQGSVPYFFLHIKHNGNKYYFMLIFLAYLSYPCIASSGKKDEE
jgi:hypothetical protein